MLDVKVGSGAFMKRPDHALELARTMVELGAREGVRTSALLTDMDTPLGRRGRQRGRGGRVGRGAGRWRARPTWSS